MEGLSKKSSICEKKRHSARTGDYFDHHGIVVVVQGDPFFGFVDDD